MLKNIDQVKFIKVNTNFTCPWFIDIYIEQRTELKKYLESNNIQTRKIYPPIPSQKFYGISKSYPVTEKYSSKGLWLPSSLTLTNKDIREICDKIHQFYEK